MKCSICNIETDFVKLDLMKCKNCGHLFSKNIYDSSYWEKLYEHNYTHEERKFDIIRNVMYAYDAAWIFSYKKFQGKFLDVGCSYGNFFTFLPSEIKKIGIEISTNVINDAKKIHPNCNFYKTDIQNFDTDEKFDFIQFRGVLQHSTNPLGDLKQAKKLLNKNGIILILSLPDFSSFTSFIYKKQFKFYLPDSAPNHFTNKSFNFLIKSLDLEIVKKDSPYLKTPYSHMFKDFSHFITNKFYNKTNPPFFGNIKSYILKIK